MAKEEKEDLKKPRTMSKEELQQALIDNFINLQKVMTNLAVKFDELSGNMSKLLQLFEISAKTFAEKYNQMDSSDNIKKQGLDEEYIKKLDILLDQNKIISKGIMLIEERLREKGETSNKIQKEEYDEKPQFQQSPNATSDQMNSPRGPYPSPQTGNRPQLDRYPPRQPSPRY